MASPGTKGDPAEINQTEMCLRMLAGALGYSAAAQGGRNLRGCHRGASWDCGGFEDSVMIRRY
jgi:hypothetical protein